MRCMAAQGLSIIVVDQRMIQRVRSFLMSVFASVLYDELLRSIEEMDRRASRANCEIVCMLSREEMVAALEVEWHYDYVHVNLFGVHQAYRAAGLPRQMLTWLEERCRKRQIARIEFETLEERQNLHRFCESLGFIKGESFTRGGLCYRRFRKYIIALLAS